MWANLEAFFFHNSLWDLERSEWKLCRRSRSEFLVEGWDERAAWSCDFGTKHMWIRKRWMGLNVMLPIINSFQSEWFSLCANFVARNSFLLFLRIIYSSLSFSFSLSLPPFGPCDVSELLSTWRSNTYSLPL